VVLRNVTTAGALGYYADVAAENGMIGFVINNTPPVMAAEGSRGGVLGAQPFAVAAPAGAHPSLRLDMTNSVMSMVRIWDTQVRGDELPPGVAVDADGEPTADPAAAINGTLLPMGHRGYALALMWEVLTGVLGGAERYADGVGMPADVAHPMAVTMFLLAIDPAAAMDELAFRGRVDKLVDHVHAAPTRPGIDRVLVPGERSHAAAVQRSDSGIPMQADVIAGLGALGAELGVAW
jgi:LDH2 family malate/lactate/ureidoglycolate dehydrogenase